MNIFETAVRDKFRFEFKGLISVEDLWDLDIVSLDLVFKNLNAKAKQFSEESLLEIRNKVDEEIETKINIVKHIVAVKQEDIQKRHDYAIRKAKEQKILEILDKKKEESLENMSEEELLEALKGL